MTTWRRFSTSRQIILSPSFGRRVRLTDRLCWKLTCHTCTFKVQLRALSSIEWSLWVQNLLIIFLSSPPLSLNYSPPSLSAHLLLLFLLAPPVFARSCSFFFLFFSLCTDWVLSLLPSAFFPAPSFFLHQIFKRFLVSTSLTRMPRYRPMALTVGFSPPLCISRTFLTPTSADIIPLCSVCPVCHCRMPFFGNTLFLLVPFYFCMFCFVFLHFLTPSS